MRFVSSDVGFLKTFWAREAKQAALISSITQKDEGAILYGYPVIQTKNPHSAQLRANLGAPSFWLKVILEIKHSLILLLTDRLTSHSNGVSRLNVQVCVIG